MCLYFSVQEEDILKYTSVKCQVSIISELVDYYVT